MRHLVRIKLTENEYQLAQALAEKVGVPIESLTKQTLIRFLVLASQQVEKTSEDK